MCVYVRYLGRKQVGNLPEPRVDGVDMLVRPQNSVLSLAYLLSKNGAKKLVWSRPLSKMIAVGEYLSVMFDQHPRSGVVIEIRCDVLYLRY